ncbi:LysE family transporter [Photobacterium galatheae]|uniref:Lysine transporter LysE n=2 Tax=Photobacterium galatheae TaxID=1654360 RepID=A0A066RZP7_9GAMM|nr:lysine transporter LysE [Photobacterium galatheae]MCM0148177.1 LysE family transporter [Photobacterium galatheae]
MINAYWPEFLSLALIHFMAVVAPGPDFVVTVRQSLKFGRTHGVMTALGIGFGLGIHVLYTLLGVSALMHTSEWLLTAAKVLGAIYLVYLGVQLCRSKPAKHNESATATNTEEHPDTPIESQSLKRAFSIGFLTNATNPKATLFFLAVMTNVVSIDTPMTVQMFYGAWMCSVNALWFTLVSLVFSAEKARCWFQRQMHLIERSLGVVLIAFAARLAFV